MAILEASEEASAMLDVADGNFMDALNLLDRQFTTLAARAQIVLTLCGVVVTVTGFSGRLIAGTSTTAQILVIAGLSLSIAAAAYIQIKVMPLEWITSDMDSNRLQSLSRMIERRNLKTAAYSTGVRILLFGMIFYTVAVAIMLLNPTPMDLPVK